MVYQTFSVLFEFLATIVNTQAVHWKTPPRILTSFIVAAVFSLFNLQHGESRLVTYFAVTLVVWPFFDWFTFLLYLPKKLPPGPFPLPLIGNAYFFVGKDMTTSLAQMRAKYGDLVTVYRGHSVGAIWSLSLNATNSILNSDANCRGFKHHQDLKNNLWATDAMEKSRRQNLATKLVIESLVSQASALTDVSTKFVDAIENNLNQPMLPAVYDCAAEYAYSLLTGGTLTNEARKAIRTMLDQIHSSKFRKMLRRLLHVLADLLPFGLNCKSPMETVHSLITSIIKKEMIKRRNCILTSPMSGPAAQNMIDHYIRCEQSGNSPMPLDDYVTMITDMFLRITLSAGSALGWAILRLAQNPSELRMLHDEVRSKISDRIVPGPEHRLHFPAVEAFIRNKGKSSYCQTASSSSSVLQWFHKTSCKIKYGNMTIPTGTTVGLGAWAVSQHDDVFMNVANPLIASRSLQQSTDRSFSNLSTFGAGAYSGETDAAAKHYAVLLTAVLVQRFRWLLWKPVDHRSEKQAHSQRMTPCLEVIFYTNQ